MTQQLSDSFIDFKFKTPIQGPILTLTYILTAKLGMTFAVVADNVTLIWPPSGLALFALLAFGLHLWPWVMIGAFVANATTDISLFSAFFIAAGNCLEAVIGVSLLRLVRFKNTLQRVEDVISLILLAAAISTTVSATIGALSLGYWQHIPWTKFGNVWLAWWLGDAMGVIVFTPLLLAWRHGTHIKFRLPHAIEATGLIISLIITAELIFGKSESYPANPLPLDFMTFPLLIWASLRFHIRGATTATFVLGCVILYNLVHKYGLFSQSNVYESQILLWLYTNVAAITSMILAASVNERREAEAGMRHLAQHDPLTGLPNRITLQEKISQAIAHAERFHKKVAILFLDIDRFKTINDTLGHSIGDQFLVAATEKLKQCVRKGDTVTRHGGDEFVIILDDISQSDDVTFIAEKTLNALHEPFDIQGIPLHVTASIGISLYPIDGNTTDILLKHADIAMYRAKELGRDNFVFYSREINNRAIEQLTMENRLRGALKRNEFIVHYQPKFDINTGQICGVEALLRWQPAPDELVMPDKFIPLLEETGLINDVGAWVLDTACKQLAYWHALGWQELHMSVNSSSRQVNHTALVQYVRESLSNNRLAAHMLELEITESMLVRQDDATEASIQQLVDLGVRLAIDDFGTGYSSLNYLHRLSIDTLKIDRSFVNNLPDNEDCVAITRAIAGLGKSLDLALVAEGIETEEQLAFLKSLGCHTMQGYFLCRPLAAEQITVMLETEHKL